MKLIEQINQAIRDNYVMVDKVDETIGALQAAVADGLSDDPFIMASQLTQELRKITNDKHFAVGYRPPQANQPEQDRPALDFDLMRHRNNNYFYEARRLAGNIGYLDLRMFPDTSNAATTAIGAMAFLSGTDALIFDLRKNRGGSPTMIQLLLSYLLPGPTLINTFYYRVSDEYTQSWTMPHVPGELMADVPVYVLTSAGTGSAAEEFAYDLQQLKRGTLVGETTAGAGHTVSMIPLEDGFSINVPSGRPINPVSGHGWEGVGVIPDIDVPATAALEKAHALALESLVEACEDESLGAFYQWELETVQAGKFAMDVAQLSQYVGHYGEREISLVAGQLFYHSPMMQGELTPIGENVFALAEDVRLEFAAGNFTIYWRDMPRRMTFSRSDAEL